MFTYTTSRNLFGKLTNNDIANNLSLGDTLMNDSIRYYCISNGGKWWFLEKETEQDTVANQEGYILPQSTRKIVDLYVTIGAPGATIWSPLAVEDPKLWKRVLQSQLGTSDRAEFYYRQNSRVLIQPIPASSGYTITIRTRHNVVDLKYPDYITGTVSILNGSNTITGVGTTFTESMVGRSINITDSDGLWYEIGAFVSPTVLTLLAPFEGIDVAASNFTIGQVSPLPEAYQILPIVRAAGMYWRMNKDVNRAQMYEGQAKELYEAMLAEANEKEEGTYMMPISALVFRDPNIPEPDVPTSSFI